MPLRATLLDQAVGCWRVTEPGLWGAGTAWVGTAVERLLLLWARAPPVPGPPSVPASPTPTCQLWVVVRPGTSRSLFPRACFH